MDRRSWLIKSGLVLTGLSILPTRGISWPSTSQHDGGKDEGPINLSSNENPYGPSPAARTAMAESIRISNRYQWKMIADLRSAIASKNDVTADNILLGAGSTEIIDNAIQLAALQKGTFVVAGLTFSRWSDAAERSGLQKIAVPLTADRRHDLAAMQRAIKPGTSMVYVCNPNNPTGTICNRKELVSFIKEATKKTMVLVDEAYLEYAKETSVSEIAVANKNLVVIKTFSKIYGLAGSRVGYAIAHKDTIERLSQLRSGAHMGVAAATLAGALASIKDDGFVDSTCSSNKKAREYTIAKLEHLGIRCIPSHTNFIYFSLANYKNDFFDRLKTNNILGTGIFEEEGKWSRITVGSMQEMEQFIGAIT